MNREPLDTQDGTAIDNDDYRPPTDDEWRERRLCSDEGCIGVLDTDGRCKECGRAHEPLAAASVPADDEQHGSASADAEENTAVVDASQDAPIEVPVDEGADDNADNDTDDEDDDWSRRTLCRDESCIGVIGPDGRCKECGLPFEP